MTKPKKFTYNIYYKDGSSQVVEWTKDEFGHVCVSMAHGERAVYTDNVALNLQEVKVIVYLPPVPPPTEEDKQRMKESAESQLSEWGFVDQDTANWLQANGIDLKGGNN
jgi:hypothetical protein